MTWKLKIALIGELNAHSLAHRAIPLALDLCALDLGVGVESEWVSTTDVASRAAQALSAFDGLWCVPSTPYRSTKGALSAITYAREGQVPFLGTCGGFQYAIVEFARNALGWASAGHGELSTSGDIVISPLECTLVDVAEPIVLSRDTAIFSAYGREHISEEFRCRYAVNPVHAERLFSGALRVSAWDVNGMVRAVELANHPFFVATLFQPERLALRQSAPPLLGTFLKSALERTMRVQQLPPASPLRKKIV
jgi:CTP synthase (UTP-ammonia lyase)